MAKDDIKMTNDFNLVVDWDKIAEEYKELMPTIDINKIATTDSCCGISYAYDLDSITIQSDRNNCDGIYSISDNTAEFEEIKRRLENLEEANDIMRTDSKVMARDLVRSENKIKELEAENSKLKEKIKDTNIALENERHINDILLAQIEYCKKNGIWIDKPYNETETSA